MAGPADGLGIALAPCPVRQFARTIRRHRRIRLISHRSYGFHSATPLIALVYLCCSGITIETPAMNFTPKTTGAP